MKKILFILSIFILGSCSSPEVTAESVCECLDKAKNPADVASCQGSLTSEEMDKILLSGKCD
tara:strand:+ start:84 stop:269 length:186 start_codon:yes stop_codon:yes gene_type:complete